MSQQMIKKKCDKHESNTIINSKLSNRNAENVPSGRDDPSTSEAAPPHKMGNLDVTPLTSEDIHAGPRSIVKEEIYLEGLNRNNILSNVDERCKSCLKEKEEKSVRGQLKKIKNYCTAKKCFMLGTLIVLIEITLLIFKYGKITKDNDRYFVDTSKMYIIENNLLRFVPRKNWTNGRSIERNDCAYQCAKLKSKVRFILMPIDWGGCSKEKRMGTYKECSVFMWTLLKTSDSPYRDIYYNYVILGDEDEMYIYEGRTLTCPHDEPFLKEDHTSMITIGISYCYPGRSVNNSKFSLKVTDTIWDLIENLKVTNKEVLTKDYVLEFPDICENSYLLEKLGRIADIGRISFYNNELYDNLNVSTKLTAETISKLVFKPKDTSENDTSSLPVKLLFPFSNDTSFHDSYHLLRNQSRITIRFYILNLFHSPEHPKVTWCNSFRKFPGECWPRIMKYFGGESLGLDRSIGNYFAFQDSSIVYGQIPVNYSSNLGDINFVVNVFRFCEDNCDENEKKSTWFAEALVTIREDIRKRITYTQIDYQAMCLRHPNRYNSFMYIYQYLIDSPVRYFQYTGPNHFTYTSRCEW